MASYSIAYFVQLVAAVCRGANATKLLLFLSLPTILMLSLTIPPFWSPDEPSHFDRVVGLATGHVLPQMYVDLQGVRFAGSPIDTGVNSFIHDRLPIEPSHNLPKPTVHEAVNSRLIYLTGAQVPTSYSNTVIYAPFLYTPAVVGSLFARTFTSSVLVIFLAARIANAVCAAGVLLLAIRLSPRLAPYTLTCAAIPMILFQSASISADALLGPLFVLFSVSCYQISRPTDGHTLVLAVTTFLISAGKVAYLPLCILPLLIAFLNDRRLSSRVLTFLLVAVLSVVVWAAWAFLVRNSVVSGRSDNPIDVHAQLSMLLKSPVRFIILVLHTLKGAAKNLILEAFGYRLGWLTVMTPKFIIDSLIILLIAASLLVMPVPNNGLSAVCAATLSGICLAAIYTLLYLQFNPVGSPHIAGLQGRYLLPLIITSAIWLPSLRIAQRELYAMVPAISALLISTTYCWLQAPRWWAGLSDLRTVIS